ncbi:hypothetical protein C3489_12670 [Streptomyces sp. Ru71]|nr:hypothetical protein C3489_12670 [Streptomyces sp. Ru71]
MDFSGNKGLTLKGAEVFPKNHAIPDITFAPMESGLFRAADSWMACDGVAMVVEVTSIKPQTDREAKRRCHARGGIPLYLLVEREASMVTLFSDPAGDDYRRLLKRAFGDPLSLPEPFGFGLDTKDFL